MNNLNKIAVHRILTDLCSCKNFIQNVPKHLSVEQKENRLEICQYLPETIRFWPDFLNIGDESWVFEYNPETKQLSEE